MMIDEQIYWKYVWTVGLQFAASYVLLSVGCIRLATIVILLT